MDDNVAFILGYTGATGKAVVQELAKSNYFKKVVLVGRRKCDLPVGADDRFVQETVDYDNIGEYSHVFKDCTVGYCCLGCTNIASPDNLMSPGVAFNVDLSYMEEFTRIDRDYVINTARVAREAGCRQFHVVTAVNTNINSRIHYRKVKGEAEEGLKEIGFPKLIIYRPGFIRARRQGGRYVVDVIYKCLVYPWLFFCNKKTKSITVEGIARAMLYKTRNPSENNVETLENIDMYDFMEREV